MNSHDDERQECEELFLGDKRTRRNGLEVEVPLDKVGSL